MDRIVINGKIYKYGGWAMCAYEFITAEDNAFAATENATVTENATAVTKNATAVTKNATATENKIVEIIKKSKELRGKDFLAMASIKMAEYLHNYDIYKNIYVPEITDTYMIEFAYSDIMQSNIDILINIIQAIQKLYTHLKLDKGSPDIHYIDEDKSSLNEIIINIENLQITLINLINLII
jgi:hypothetical protein